MTQIITIEVEKGMVIRVRGLPQDWIYQVKDWDICPVCGDCEPFCEVCREYYEQRKEEI